MTSRKIKLINSFTDLIFPPLCPFCTEAKDSPVDRTITKDGLCLICLSGLTSIETPICKVCGTSFSSASGGLCGACIKTSPPFSQARSAFTYDGNLLAAIHRFKYNGATLLGPTLGGLAAKALTGIDADFDRVVPIPLHINRLRRRGFNQSLLLARGVLPHCRNSQKIKIDHQNLLRIKDTRSQVELKEKERETNVKGAFSVIDKSAFSGKKILLVDDVYTTGATIRECSRVLSACGAVVYGLTLARVVRV